MMEEIERHDEELRKDGHGHLLDGPQVAAILRCSISSLYVWRREGAIETVYPVGSGRPMLFERREVARYLAECARG